MTIKQAYQNFKDSDDFLAAFDSATKASWGGSGYSLELFPDKTYRILWDNNIGNLYCSEGIIIGIPALSEDEWDEDVNLRFYDNAIELLDEVALDQA